MASKKKALASASVAALLAQIVGFGPAGGYVTKSDELAALVTGGDVEQGPDSDDGRAAVRATAAGVAKATATPAAPTAIPAPEGMKPTFTLATNVPVPDTQRGGNKGKSIYPFAEMQVGQSFFIAATAETPEPWKSLASTATSATRRYDETVMQDGKPVMETVKVKGVDVTREQKVHTRVFVMRQIKDGAPWGHTGVAGAGVFRTK